MGIKGAIGQLTERLEKGRQGGVEGRFRHGDSRAIAPLEAATPEAWA